MKERPEISIYRLVFTQIKNNIMVKPIPATPPKNMVNSCKFDGVTESLLFVVERSNKNQNLQRRNLFNKCFERFELQLPVVELGTIEITQKHVILFNNYMTNCPRDDFKSSRLPKPRNLQILVQA